MDYDLHARILTKLAETLADSRAKTTPEEVTRLRQRCTPLISESTEKTLKKEDEGTHIVMVSTFLTSISLVLTLTNGASIDISWSTRHQKSCKVCF